MRLKRIAIVAVLLAVIAAPVSAEEPAATSDWQYTAVLYGWLAGLEGTIGVGDALQEPVDVSFADLLGYVDFALAGHFEARNLKTVFLTDIAYTDLGGSKDGQIGNQPVSVDVDIKQWIFELGGGYRATPEIDLLFVGRYYLLDMGVTSTSEAGSETGETDQGWGDLFVGARYSKTFREKWIASVRGDIGAGGSDFAWAGAVNLGYHFTDHLSGLASWRVLSVDRESGSDDNYFKYDMVQSGLGIGLGWRF